MTVELDAEPRVLGRQPSGAAGVAVSHPTVSRRHVAISMDTRAGVHVAADLGSRNGTHLQGAPLGAQAQPLTDQAVLAVGDVLFVYEQLDAAATNGSGAAVDLEAVPGRAAVMNAVRARLEQAARDRAPMLLFGETGTGKERMAAEVHRLSGRTGPLVAVNVAALSPSLVESELFGHVKGAFTGATEAQPGLFRAADGGTLFLDEVGELPLAMQPKLLRAVQEGEVMPVGSTRVATVDVRVVTATHQDLAYGAEQGSFRRDLYARLTPWTVPVPPLRQRRVDILWWLDVLQTVWATSRNDIPKKPPPLACLAAQALLLSPWPDNLRGLDRLLHDLALLPQDTPVTQEQLPAWLTRPPPPSSVLHSPTAAPATAPAPNPKLPAPSRDELQDALTQLGSVRAVARHYGRDRRQVYRWLQAHGLTSPAEGADEKD